MSLLTPSGLQQRALTSLYRHKAAIPGGKHLVTFTFDDFNASAYRIAGKLLVEAGARGTYYAAPGLMNTGEDFFTTEDVTRLVADEHDLQCHTYSHISGQEHPIAAYRADVERGKAVVAALRRDRQCAHFAYPYGHVTLSAKREFRRLFTSCRGIVSGLNGPVVDLNLLRANRLYSDSVSTDSVRQLVDQAKLTHGWLIFYTHDVRAVPSKYGCTPEYFQAVLDHVIDSGAQVVTVSEAVGCLTQ